MKRFNLDELIKDYEQAINLLEKVKNPFKEIDNFLKTKKGVKYEISDKVHNAKR